MGTDPHGLVFYGFALVDEDGSAIQPWQDGESEDNEEEDSVSLYCDWEEVYIEKKGGISKPVTYDYHAPEWEEWRAKREFLLKSGNVDVVLAGYSENLINCIVIKESYVRAEWDKILPLKILEAKPEWDKQIQEWCKLLDIEYHQPSWHVAALYF